MKNSRGLKGGGNTERGTGRKRSEKVGVGMSEKAVKKEI